MLEFKTISELRKFVQWRIALDEIKGSENGLIQLYEKKIYFIINRSIREWKYILSTEIEKIVLDEENKMIVINDCLALKYDN